MVNNSTIYNISLAGNPNSCLLKIQDHSIGSLLDTGADISLIHTKIFNKLKNKPNIIRDQPKIQSVHGGALSVEGYIDLPFTLRKQSLAQKCYIVDGINRNMILGRDFLKQNGARIYFDLGSLRIGKTYVRLEEDIHISSILRLTRKILIKLKTVNVCTVMINKGFNIQRCGLIKISGLNSGYLREEPGLIIGETIAKVSNPRKVPIILFNQSDKFFHFRRGTVVGQGEYLQEHDIKSVNEINKDNAEFMVNIDAPEEHKNKIEKIISSNRNLFAQKDTELGHTETVKMRLDTGGILLLKIGLIDFL